MGLERNLRALTSLGLTRTEAEIYIFLTQNGAQEKDSIANVFNISKQQLSQNLTELQEKGFINTEPKRSNTFSALPLERVLEKIVASKLREAQQAIKEKEKFPKPEQAKKKARVRRAGQIFKMEENGGENK